MTSGRVFISHASHDKGIAHEIAEHLEDRHIRCWIAPRDLSPGAPYGEALVDAIAEAAAMVVVLTRGANESRHVVREVERAISRGVPVVPFLVEDVTPAKGLEYFLSTEHWLDARLPPLRGHIETLADSVAALVGASKPARAPESRSEREVAARAFEEMAPDEWQRKPGRGLMNWISRLLTDKE